MSSPVAMEDLITELEKQDDSHLHPPIGTSNPTERLIVAHYANKLNSQLESPVIDHDFIIDHDFKTKWYQRLLHKIKIKLGLIQIPQRLTDLSPYIRIHMIQFGFSPSKLETIKAFYNLKEPPIEPQEVLHHKLIDLCDELRQLEREFKQHPRQEKLLEMQTVQSKIDKVEKKIDIWRNNLSLSLSI